MATTLMQDDLIFPDGSVAANVTVQIRKLAPKAVDDARDTSQSLTLIGWENIETDAAGHWEADLIPTADLTPGGTVYQALAYQDEKIVYNPVFNVPGTGPAWVGDNLTAAPEDFTQPLNVNFGTSGWTVDTFYSKSQGIDHNGSSYVALIDHTSTAATEPGVGADWETVWFLLAAKGDPGDIDSTIFDAKGDLIGASAADTAVRIPAGAVGEFPIRDDAATSGISWIKEAHINPWDPRWGLVFNGTAGDDSPAIQAMHDALPADGGKILLPEGHGFLSTKLTFSKPIVLEAAGTGTAPSLAATLLTVAAGVTGIELAVGGQKQRLQDFYLESQSTASGTDDGITVKAPRAILDNITVDKFGRYGIAADTSTSGNANLGQWRSVRASNNKSHGFYMIGGDSNVISLITCDAQGNGGWGFYNDAASNLFDNIHNSGNTSGAVYDDGNSSLYLNPYVEGGTGNNVTFDSGARAIRWIAGIYTNPTITDNAVNTVILVDGAWGDSVGRNSRFRHYGFMELLRTAAQINSTVFRIFNASEAQPRVQYLGTGEMRWSDGTATPDTTLRRAAAGIFYVTDAFRMPERADPPAPGTNDGIIYMRDDGAGKTQLVVRFNTGAVQVIATEP